MTNKKILLLAIICGLLTVGLVSLYLNQIRTAMDNVATGQVMVAKVAIAARTELKPEMYEAKNVPTAYIHPRAITKSEELAGKIAVSDITEGEQILNTKVIGNKDTSKGLDYVIPKGKRAISIGINQVTGVSDMVKPGNHVDVIGMMDVDPKTLPGAVPVVAGNTAAQKEVPVTRMALQDIQVLAVDQMLSDVIPPPAKDDAAKENKTLTLAVTPEEAEKLTLITERGIIRVVLRSPVEDGKYIPKPYSPKDFLKR